MVVPETQMRMNRQVPPSETEPGQSQENRRRNQALLFSMI